MEAEAEVYAHVITDHINQNPRYWQFESSRFLFLLQHQMVNENGKAHRQLFDNNHEIVAENNSLLLAPVLHIKKEVYDSGTPAGYIKISRSIRNILQNSVLVFLLSSLLGTLVYYLQHLFPLRTLRSTFAQLYAEKERATITLKSITDSVITTDKSLRILSFNDAVKNLLGSETSKLYYTHFNNHFNLVDPKTGTPISPLIFKNLLSGYSSEIQYKHFIFIRKDNKRQFHLKISASQLRNEKNELLGLIIVCQDITDSFLFERQLKDTVEELEIILRNAGVGIVFIKNSIIQQINVTASEIFGQPVEKIVGMPAATLLSDTLGYSGSVDRIYERLMQNEPVDFEHEMIRSDNKRIWLRIIGQGVDHLNLKRKGSVWIIQDITQLKKSLIELETAKCAAEKANQFKSEFLAHVSHELRSPLSGIIGLNQLVLEAELPAEQKKHLQVIDESANHLLLLLNNLLDLSKIEAGVMELEDKTFSIDSVFSYVENIVSLQCKEKGLFLSFSKADNVPVMISGDELRLGQILLNLVGNGVKFTSAGGINVTCQTISETVNTIKLEFAVRDTGCGISSEAQKRIFQAFVQASSSDTREHGGSGLGLSICKKLAELMGGDIGVISKPGTGSTFTFTANLQKPLAKDQHRIVADEQIKRPFEKLPTALLRILFVEDINFNQTLGKLLLEPKAERFDIAADGLEALQILSVNDYDVVFMDIHMPRMDGLVAARLIRRCEREEIPVSSEHNELLKALAGRLKGKHLPIIAMTANATQEAHQECLTAGMDNYITKPFDQGEMLEILEREISIYRPQVSIYDR